MNRELNTIYQQILLPWIAGGPVIIEPLIYEGPIAGSEFLTYSALKVYLVNSLSFGQTATVGSTLGQIDFYDLANSPNFLTLRNGSVVYDGTAAANRIHTISAEISNIYFSRLVQSVYVNMRFIGYKIRKL